MLRTPSSLGAGSSEAPSLGGKGSGKGVAKPWRKLKDFDGGQSEDVIVLQELMGVAFLRWDDPPITYYITTC